MCTNWAPSTLGGKNQRGDFHWRMFLTTNSYKLDLLLQLQEDFQTGPGQGVPEL